MLELRPSPWEEYVCTSELCHDRSLYVQPMTMVKDTWSVAASSMSQVWTIAAPTPLCPFCGETLVNTAAPEEIPLGLQAA